MMFRILTALAALTVSYLSFAHSISGSEQWHFHTGEGIAQQKFVDQQGNEKMFNSSCALSRQDPACREKIYVFSKEDIEQIIEDKMEVYEERSKNSLLGMVLYGYVAVQSGYAVWTTSHGIGGTVGTWVGRLSFASRTIPWLPGRLVSITISGTIAVGSTVMAVLDAKRMQDIYQTTSAVADLFLQESLYVNRCGHMSRNFLNKLGNLGVVIHFPENSYRLISSEHYLKGIEDERRLVEQTKERANDSGVSYKEAYADFFVNSCGQMPLHHNSLPTATHPRLY